LNKLILLLRLERRVQLALRVVERALGSGMTRSTLGGQLGPDRPAIARIVGPDDELVGLEPIDELRDVGANAGGMLRERAQGKRLDGFDELSEHAEFRHRQSQRLDRRFQARRDPVERPHKLDGQGPVGPFIHDCNIQLLSICVKRPALTFAFYSPRFAVLDEGDAHDEP
jgi:hypothetical protein